jgi:hypothetical protein
MVATGRRDERRRRFSGRPYVIVEEALTQDESPVVKMADGTSARLIRIISYGAFDCVAQDVHAAVAWIGLRGATEHKR